MKWIKGPRSEFNSGNDFVVVRDNVSALKPTQTRAALPAKRAKWPAP